MAESHQTGKKGEEIATQYLVKAGYEVLDTNWQSNHQEIDIIARTKDLLIFAEVKTRRSDAYGSPEVFVTRAKQKMLIKAANHYMALHKMSLEARFDIITVLFRGNNHTLNHIQGAFSPTIH